LENIASNVAFDYIDRCVIRFERLCAGTIAIDREEGAEAGCRKATIEPAGARE
jgi:hypothetical protein